MWSSMAAARAPSTTSSSLALGLPYLAPRGLPRVSTPRQYINLLCHSLTVQDHAAVLRWLEQCILMRQPRKAIHRKVAAQPPLACCLSLWICAPRHSLPALVANNGGWLLKASMQSPWQLASQMPSQCGHPNQAEEYSLMPSDCGTQATANGPRKKH